MKRRRVSKPALKVLRLGLPTIIFSLLILIRQFLTDRIKDPVLALARYPVMLQYILTSLALLILGAFLFDYLAETQSTDR